MFDNNWKYLNTFFGNVWQYMTILTNTFWQCLTMSRRRSIADYAFPELHPDTALKRSSRNLLIYTRTRCSLEMTIFFKKKFISKKSAHKHKNQVPWNGNSMSCHVSLCQCANKVTFEYTFISDFVKNSEKYLVNLLARILRVEDKVLPSLFFLQGDE